MTKVYCALAVAALLQLGSIATVNAGEEEQCLDCHEPAEDWEGLSRAEIVEAIRAPDNRRHKDNRELSDEQITAILAELLPELPPTASE